MRRRSASKWKQFKFNIKDRIHPMWNEHLIRPGIDIEGRPDFEAHRRGEAFGVTYAKTFPKYIHSIGANSCLIHKVTAVRMSWYAAEGSWLRRLDTPFLAAECVCGAHIVMSGRRAGKTCEIPDPAAVLCGRCHGELPTFSKRRKIRIKKRWAKDHLGCKGLHEVIGPYQPPKEDSIGKP